MKIWYCGNKVQYKTKCKLGVRNDRIQKSRDRAGKRGRGNGRNSGNGGHHKHSNYNEKNHGNGHGNQNDRNEKEKGNNWAYGFLTKESYKSTSLNSEFDSNWLNCGVNDHLFWYMTLFHIQKSATYLCRDM